MPIGKAVGVTARYGMSDFITKPYKLGHMHCKKRQRGNKTVGTTFRTFCLPAKIGCNGDSEIRSFEAHFSHSLRDVRFLPIGFVRILLDGY